MNYLRSLIGGEFVCPVTVPYPKVPLGLGLRVQNLGFRLRGPCYSRTHTSHVAIKTLGKSFV